MNDKEKKAIGMCRLLLNGDITLHVIDDDGGTAYAGTVNKTYNDDLETVLNIIENQKAELDNLKTIEEENKFLRNQELGYIAGYEDGKKHKMTAVAMRIENMKYELYERHIKALKKRIEDLLSIEETHRKENSKLRAEIEKENSEWKKLCNECSKVAKSVGFTKEDTDRIIKETREMQWKAKKYDELIEKLEKRRKQNNNKYGRAIDDDEFPEMYEYSGQVEEDDYLLSIVKGVENENNKI